jgi:hypothetical protein
MVLSLECASVTNRGAACSTLATRNFAVFANITHLTLPLIAAGGGAKAALLSAAAYAAVDAATGLKLSWRYKSDHIGRNRIAKARTAHLLVVAG